jgi:uncharacterized protein
VETNEMPDERAMTALHRDQIWVLRIRGAIAALFPIGAFLVFDRSLPPQIGVPSGLMPAIVAVLALVALLVLPRRRWRAWGYREEEDELHIRHGLFTRIRTVVPFGRVQHIDVAQGPIERSFGLATLILHTAGTRGASVPLPGLLFDDAERMRDRIRIKIRQDLT